jgi:hypothetical protein
MDFDGTSALAMGPPHHKVASITSEESTKVVLKRRYLVSWLASWVKSEIISSSENAMLARPTWYS